MSSAERELNIQRILVALDASPHSLAALEAAAQLAATLGAELIGLFVEDVNLLRLAELPFVQEVGLFSATSRELSSQRVEWELRAQAAQARQALAKVAGQARVRWSFRVVRGVVSSEVLTAAAEVDLVTLGKVGWSPGQSRRLGSTTRAVLSNASNLTLITQQGARLGRPVLVIYDGSSRAERALAAAARLAGPEGALTVLLLARGAAEAQRLQHRAAAWLQRRGVKALYRRMRKEDLPRLAHMIETEGGGVLVLPSESDLLSREKLQQLLNNITCPVLLVH